MIWDPTKSTPKSFHRDRVRASSFGTVAALYDQHRPDYPSELFDTLLDRCPATARILDIGCGTGKVALPLLRRGHTVLGLEPDPKMAALAQSHGIPVEIANFETWDPAGRTFDLLACGAAWHWIDPSLGIPQAANLLHPGGTFAIFYNLEIPAEPIRSALDSVYNRLEPGLLAGAGEHTQWLRGITLPQDLFESEAHVSFAWIRTLTTAQWIAMITTTSNHQVLPPGRLEALKLALGETIENLGGQVTTQGETYTLLARRR